MLGAVFDLKRILNGKSIALGLKKKKKKRQRETKRMGFMNMAFHCIHYNNHCEYKYSTVHLSRTLVKYWAAQTGLVITKI